VATLTTAGNYVGSFMPLGAGQVVHLARCC
jgi:hypothetical protein